MIKVEFENGRAMLYTPYNKSFVSEIKTIGGARWTGSCWTIPEEEIDRAREIMKEVYGESDLQKAETVTVTVEFPAEYSERCSAVTLWNKTIAQAFGRDSGARLGQDVSLLTGGIRSGGSAKNWASVVKEGSTFRIRNVSKDVFKDAGTPDYINIIDVVEDGTEREKLIAEREKLMARLAEIDSLLEEMA